MTSAPAAVGDFITIPAWETFGQVVDIRPATMGTPEAIEVLVEHKPDDPDPRWYRLEPGAYINEGQ